jgi:hypothetical protein
VETRHLSNTQLGQVAIVVDDIETYAANYASLLGVEKPEILLTEPGQEVRLNYRGQESMAQCKLAFFNLGNVELELIEPVGADSAWAEGLRDGGISVHHIAFWTENMAEDKRVLDSHETPMIMRGDMMEEGQYAYFDGRKNFGVMLELLETKRTDLS